MKNTATIWITPSTAGVAHAPRVIGSGLRSAVTARCEYGFTMRNSA